LYRWYWKAPCYWAKNEDVGSATGVGIPDKWREEDVVADETPVAVVRGGSAGIGRPDEITGVVVFCAARANTFVTSAHINVDGGSDFA
jgi:NAD(P)-dependent dehydrogenase (short-subunit alcohol dehydrogenase family)